MFLLSRYTESSSMSMQGKALPIWNRFPSRKPLLMFPPASLTNEVILCTYIVLNFCTFLLKNNKNSFYLLLCVHRWDLLNADNSELVPSSKARRWFQQVSLIVEWRDTLSSLINLVNSEFNCTKDVWLIPLTGINNQQMMLKKVRSCSIVQFMFSKRKSFTVRIWPFLTDQKIIIGALTAPCKRIVCIFISD